MNKIRFPMLIVIVSLVAVIGVSILTFQNTIQAQGRSLANPVGFGDLHYLEARQSIPAVAGLPGSRSYTGMGDLHISESRQLIPAAGGPAGIRTYAGMGDLHRFETQP